MRIRLLWIGLGVFLGCGILRADWEVVTQGGMEFVTLKSFCEFYHLTYSSVGEQEYFKAKGNGTEIVFRRGSREVLIDGVRHWLSFSIETGAKDWLISRRDLAKLFEPVLRPEVVEQGHEWKGVLIDPGHGGEDRGAASRRGKREKDCTLDTAMRLEKILKEAKIPVAMTRRTDVFIELSDRARMGDRYKDYVFVSIHYNDATGSARGIETYCLSPWGGGSTDAGGKVYKFNFQKMPGNDNDLLNILLANKIHREVISALNPNDSDADRGVKRARFVVLKECRLPAVLVEGGFLSNRQEASRIEQVEYRQKLAEAIARGIKVFFRNGKPLEKPALPKISPASTNLTTNPVVKPIPEKPATHAAPVIATNVIVNPSAPETTPSAKQEPQGTNSVEPEVIIYPLQPRMPQPDLRKDVPQEVPNPEAERIP